MPISEDELDDRIHSSMSQSHRYRYSGLSKAEQRKNNKPIMEKRRRARINQCLNELKTLILDATNKDPSRHTKLEKADILEMTVKHLQSIQRQQLSIAVASDPTVMHKFKTGFKECATEVSQYIGHLEGVESGVKQRLVNHLTDYITGVHGMSSNTFQNLQPQDVNGRLSNTEDVNNNNSRFQNTTGFHLIPSRLPTGELALLLPNSSPLTSLFSSSLNADRSHPSAFTAVAKDKIGSITSSCSSGENTEVPRYLSPHPEVSSTSNDGCGPIFKVPETSKTPGSNYQSIVHTPLIQKTDSNSEYSNLVCDFSFQRDKNPDFLRPISVYTDGIDYPSRTGKNDQLYPKKSDKIPLDFSVRKEMAESSDQQRKRPLEDISCNIQSLPKKIKSSLLHTKNTDVEDLSKPRTSKVEKTLNSNCDMWRPW